MKIHVSMKKIEERDMNSQAPMYVYATEMVSSYYSEIGVQDKKVLSVCGSGDQVLNAYFFGAENVTGFDLNVRSEHITRLKIAAVKELSYEQFLEYFGEHETGTFSHGLYLGISRSLEEETRDFFDNLYSSFDFDGGRMVRSSYFRQRSDFGRGDTKLVNAYLESESDYLVFREALEPANFVFVQSNIKDVASKLAGEFDLINLSNVPGYYIDTIRDMPDPDAYIFDEVFTRLMDTLAEGGKMFYYAYSPLIYPNRIAPSMPTITRDSTVERFKKEFNITQRQIEGYTEGTLDKIIILEKN